MKVILLALLLTLLRADLPVHCLKSQIVGKWQLHLAPPTLRGHGPLACGHDIPDNPDTSYKLTKLDTDKVIKVELDSDYQVHPLHSKKVSGQWTMVYDEGFQVEHNQIVYFAFS